MGRPKSTATNFSGIRVPVVPAEMSKREKRERNLGF
jgi:hypothetical protein